MKKILLLKMIIFLLCNAGHAQENLPKIYFDEFTDIEREKFSSNNDITTTLSEGFLLYVKSEYGVTKVTYKNSAKTEDIASGITKLTPTSVYDIYEVKGVPVLDDNTSELTICKDKDCKKLTLKVKPGTNQSGIVTGNKVLCDTEIFKPRKDCPDPKFEKYFGLDPDDFTVDDVIYVYDFNKITSKRRVYKFVKEGVDFNKSKVNMSAEKLKGKNQVWIKIHGINRFVYDVSIKDSLFYYDSKPSALFNKMFLGDSTSVLGKLIDIAGAQSKTKADEVNEIKNKLRCFNDMYTSLKAEVIKAYDPCAEFSCCNEVDYKKISGLLSDIRSDISLLQLEFTDAKKELEELKKEDTECDQKDANIKKLVGEIEVLTKELATLKDAEKINAQKELIKGKTTAKDAIKPCEAPILTDAERNAKVKTLQENIAIVNGLDEIEAALPPDSDIKKVAVFLLNLVEQNHALIKGPIQLDGNLFDFTVDITSKQTPITTFEIPGHIEKLHYTIPILNKPFVSFSSGSFIALGKDLLAKTYSWQPVTSNGTAATTGYTLAESGYSNPPAGFSALVNVERKTSRSFGVGLSAGVGLTIEEKPRLAYLAGGSLFFGDKRQLAVTGGFAAMQVDHISRSFETAFENQIVYTTKEAIDYYKEFRVGAFISLTYTPFTISKSK